MDEPGEPVELPRPTREVAAGARLLIELDMFLDTLAGLREVSELASPMLDEYDSARSDQMLERLGRETIRRVPEDRRQSAAAAAQAWVESIGDVVGAADDAEKHQQMQRGLMALAKGMSDDLEIAGQIVVGIFRFFLHRPRVDLLQRSILIAAVSAFEVHVGQIAAAFYRSHPRAMTSGDRGDFTVAEVLDAASQEELIETLVDHRVEGLVRLPFGGWMKWFKARGIDAEALADDLAATREVIERRHVLVHHGGRASRRYVTGVEANVELGHELLTDSAYVARAIDRLVVLGLALSTAFRMTHLPQTPVVTGGPNVKIYEHLVRRARWESVVAASRIVRELISEPTEDATARVNEWLGLKRLHGIESVRAPIQAWDPPGLELQLAKSALLDDTDRALELLAEVLGSGAVSATEAREWPLLEEIRRDARYEAVLGATNADLGAER